MTNKLKALLSPFRYTVTEKGGIAIERLLDKTQEYVIIPEGVTVIWDRAFEGATCLKKLYLPKTLRYIGTMVFWDCRDLREIHLGDLDAYMKIRFEDFPDKSLNYYQDGKLITSDAVPEGTKKIPDFAFCGMGSLKEVILPEGLEEIGRYAFAYAGLEAVTLPRSLKTLGSYAFWSNAALTEVEIPEGITQLSYAAFGCCSSLSEIKLPKTLRELATESLKYTAIKELTVPPRVTRLGDNLCRECHNLEKVTIPENVETIGDYAFYRCTALKELSMENGLISIGINAISHCDSLVELTVPRTVKSIGHNAFSANPRLEKLHLPPYTVSLGQGIVSGCPSLVEISTDGYAYVNGALIQIRAYEETMGKILMSVDDASYLATLPIPRQIDLFRLKMLTVREIDDCEVGRSLIMKTLTQSVPDALLTKGGVIVGVIVGGVTVLAGETKQIYYGEDNNGAGTKSMSEYATLMIARTDTAV